MTKLKISPFAPSEIPSLLPIAGFKMATAETGIKYKTELTYGLFTAALVLKSQEFSQKTFAQVIQWSGLKKL